MDQLCILLGRPPVELRQAMGLWKEEDERTAERLRTAASALTNMLRKGTVSRPEDVAEVERLWRTIGSVYIPTAPKEVAVGVPADLVRRRPDVRRAERQAAAQGEQIGIAEAALYPAFSVDGNIGFRAQDLAHLVSSQAFTGSVGPTFRWDLLNYGRLVNNVRYQEALFQQAVAVYQQGVLTASSEVENGLVSFLQNQEQAQLLAESAEAGQRAVIVSLRQLQEGTTIFNQYAVIEQALVQQDDLWAQARGQIAEGLIQVYRALGGGWQIRLEQPEGATPAAVPAVPEAIPAPPPAPREGHADAGDLGPSRLPGTSRASAVNRTTAPGGRDAATPAQAATQPDSAGWTRRKDAARSAE
jgi:hypothetical protein